MSIVAHVLHVHIIHIDFVHMILNLSGTKGTTFAKSCWCVYEVADVTCVVMGMHLFAIVFTQPTE